MKDEITDLILRVAQSQQASLPRPIETEKRADAGLYGPGGTLDSLALVRLIVAIEMAVEDRFGTPVTLANERAMSQKRSPFLTVGSLAAYIEELLTDAGVKQTA
jgi:D-alanine--poly(phosphoribitol) ligase subunit 2